MIILLVNSCKAQKKEDLNIIITSQQIELFEGNDYEIEYSISNLSEKDYVVVIDTTRVLSYNSEYGLSLAFDDKHKKRQLFQPRIQLENSRVLYDYTDNYFMTLPPLKEIIKNKVQDNFTKELSL